jgi:pyridoxamine 5'-phosphate oxidase
MREPTAMVLATSGPDGRTTARVVLLRGFDARGFVFYTNTRSLKGRQIAANPSVALCFYCDALAEQVRIEGLAQPVSSDEADAYWRTRPRDSQLAACISDQSDELPDRATLESRFAELCRQFGDGPVPRPEHWSGFRIVAQRIEFWSSRPARLHDRTLYERSGGQWQTKLLYP